MTHLGRRSGPHGHPLLIGQEQPHVLGTGCQPALDLYAARTPYYRFLLFYHGFLRLRRLGLGFSFDGDILRGRAPTPRARWGCGRGLTVLLDEDFGE